MRPQALRYCIACTALIVTLAGCDSGNLKTASAGRSPPAPPVRAPFYDPYATPGQVPATWTPPVYDRDGTIIHPHDPSVEWDFEDYQHAPWLAGKSPSAPPGTF